MDTGPWQIVALLAFALGAALAWGAAHWWFGRKLRAAASSRERVDKARQFAAEQASQARRQIESLQQEMAALRMGQSRRVAAVKPFAPASSPPAAPEPDEPRPQLPADGFADTQVLGSGKR